MHLYDAATRRPLSDSEGSDYRDWLEAQQFAIGRRGRVLGGVRLIGAASRQSRERGRHGK